MAIALLALAGCGGHARHAPTPADAIAHFSPVSERIDASFAALNQQAVRNPDGLRKAALARLTASDPNVRYGALYGLSLTAIRGSSLDALVPFLKSGNPTERVLAAETLVAQQDERGIPVLIDALDSTAPFAHWAPPRRVWEEAQRVLLRFVPEDLGLRRARTVRAASAAKRAWARWWARHGSGFQLRPTRRFG